MRWSPGDEVLVLDVSFFTAVEFPGEQLLPGGKGIFCSVVGGTVVELVRIVGEVEEFFVAAAAVPNIFEVSVGEPLETLAEQRVLPVEVLPPWWLLSAREPEEAGAFDCRGRGHTGAMKQGWHDVTELDENVCDLRSGDDAAA